MFLEGSTFNVFDELDEKAMGDYDKLKFALPKASPMRPSEACELFISRKLIFVEPVEVIISDLKRLAGLIGIKSVDMNTVEPFFKGSTFKSFT